MTGTCPQLPLRAFTHGGSRAADRIRRVYPARNERFRAARLALEKARRGNLIVAETAMNTRVTFYRTKTISDYPLLVGEILRRAAIRDMRKEKWRRFVKKLSL